MLTFDNKSKLLNKKDFVFGVATSSFQIEGGHDKGGRTPSIWDDFCLQEGRVKGGDDGRQGVRHYDFWQQDLDLIKELHFDAYRFSISWSRVMSERGKVNQQGIDFYHKLIDGLNQRGIKPFITLYHWDLPSYLENHGGWINRETSYEFANYAQLIAQQFGEKVSSIATHNEPLCAAFCGYLWGIHAPGYKDRRMAFQAAHHLMLGHGLAMQKLRTYAPNAENGIVINFTPAYAASNDEKDQLACKLADAEQNFWFTDALFRSEYPEELIKAVPDSKPTIFPGDMEIISQPIDFLGVNFYSRQVVTMGDEGYKSVNTEGPKTDIGWEVYPQALYDLFQDKLAQRYSRLPPLYITENGAAFNDSPDNKGVTHDQRRMDYYQEHLNQVDKLITKGFNIKGYFCWSLLDNFEWAEGYSQRFGMVYVDYETWQRIPKDSALMFQDFLAKRQ